MHNPADQYQGDQADSRVDDSDADAFAILALLLIVFFTVVYTLSI